MTFILGGFLQSLGRTLRALVRPFFLPPGSVPPPPSKTSKPQSAATSAATSETDTAAPAPPQPPRKIPPPPQTPIKWFYDVVGIIATQLALNFAVAPFMLLSIEASITAWRAVYFYGLVMAFLPILVFRLGLAGLLKAKLKKRDHKATSEAALQERKRIEWEAENERKRKLRGEGIASMGMDVERLMEEEEKEAARRERREAREAKKEL